MAKQPHRFLRRVSVTAPALAAVGVVALATPALATSTAPTTLRVQWSSVPARQSPPPLEFAAAAFDSDTGTVVLFGGIGPGGSPSDTTWVWDGTTWTSEQPSLSPPARAMASMAFDPKLHQLVLFGGVGAGQNLLNDTWTWNGQSWYELSGGQQPAVPPREGAAMAYDRAGDLVLFGGRGYAPGYSPPAPATSTTTAPPTTVPATTVVPTTTQPTVSIPPSSTTVPASGTAAPLVTLGDTWVWNGSGWYPGPASGPSARSDASMAYDSARAETVLFGGNSAPAGAAATPLGDTWVWTGSSWVVQKARLNPAARFDAGFADDPAAGGPVLFGGTGAAGVRSDIWKWAGNSWLAAGPSGSAGARVGPAVSFDPLTGQDIVFGGATTGGGVLGTTMALSVDAAPLPVTVTTTPAPPPKTTTTIARPPTARPGNTAPPAVATTIQVMPASTQQGATTPVAGGPVLRRGSVVDLTGRGFKPGAIITITFHSTPETLGHVAASRSGTFAFTVSVPRNATPGTHHFIASGEGKNGREAELVAAVFVAGAGLPTLGSTWETAILLVIAVLIPLLTWIAIGTFASHRRRLRGTA